jgi:O-acetylserine/cysteine efflux transporter
VDFDADSPIIVGMTRDRRAAILALAAAGTLWGLTVPLSKLGLEWLGAGWLAVARFAVAAPLLALFARRGVRAALTPGIVAAGALGYGIVIVLQNAGIERTSVSHAALIVGAVPVLVAVIAALLGRGSSGRLAWAGALLALAGVGLVAGGGAAGTSLAGDVLVLVSVTGSAAFIVVQPALLAGREPAAVTAVQLGAGGLAALPLAIVLEGAPPAPTGVGAVGAVLALALVGTLVAFSLFAWAQARVPAELAGAFVNLEPLVGALTGAVAFHDVVGPAQVLGGAAILAGIALGALPRRRRTGGALRDARPAHGRARPEMHRPALRGAHELLRGGRKLEDHVRVRGRGGVGGDGVRVRPLHRVMSALDGHREDAHGGLGLDLHGQRIGCGPPRGNS